MFDQYEMKKNYFMVNANEQKKYIIIEDLRFVSAVVEFRKIVVLPLDQSSSNLSWSDKLAVACLQGEACDNQLSLCHEFPVQTDKK